MSKSEKSILNETLIEVSSLADTLVYRNNSGQAWQGKPVQARIGQTIVVQPGMTILQDARPITFGLTGSGDIMGASAGRPLAIEIKDAVGRQSDAQRNFEAAWRRAGGIYLLVRSSAEAVMGLRHG